MARVKIQPGGKLIIGLVALGAMLFLFFELKPTPSKKPKTLTVVGTPTQSEPARVAEAPRRAEAPPQVGAPVRERGQQQSQPQEAKERSPIRIYFDFNRAFVNKNVYCIFDRIENVVRQDGSGRIRIVVEGNADSIGPSWYNLELSRRRAARVADSLAKRLGVPPGSISIVASGSSKPIATNSTRAGRADNRRTDVIIFR